MSNAQEVPIKHKQAEKLARLLSQGKQKEASRLAGTARLWARRAENGWIIGQHGKKEPLLSPANNPPLNM